MTRARVRLLGPCFKTGQVETDLLAVDCHSHAYARRIRRTLTAAFRREAPKQRPDNALAFAERTARALRHTPLGGEFTPFGALKATPSDTRYNTGEPPFGDPRLPPRDSLNGCPSLPNGHGFSSRLKKCTAQRER